MEHTASPTAVAFLLGVLGVGLGAVLVAVVARYLAFRRAEAREIAWLEERAAAPLSPGARRVVRGQVDVDGDDDVAVRVAIEQLVKDHTSKNSRWHTWNERERRVDARPFYLQLPDGEPVYVEPDPAALVVDEIESIYPLDRPRCRTRTADVRRGETYFAYGDLARGPHPRAKSAYRDGTGWVLRAPRGVRMLLATSALVRRYDARARFLRLVAWIAIPVFVAYHALVTYPFVVASLFGEVTSAEVERVWTYTTTHKGKTTVHDAMQIAVPGAARESFDVASGTYEWARARQAAGERVEVPVVRAPAWTSTVFLGETPYVAPFALVFATVVGGIAGILVYLTYVAKAPWYDRRKLNEHGGQGHWVEPRPHAPVDPRVDP